MHVDRASFIFEHSRTASSDEVAAPNLPFDDLAGPSEAVAHLKGQIHRVAPYFRTAMLTGERHCGDATAAEMLHRLSPLADRPRLTLNSTDAELLLGEGFPPSAIVEAGALFITWPERLSRSAQMTLLRLLRQRKPQPPRIIVFAEHGLKPLVSTGNFSAELESTLSALRIALPRLRDRAEDIPSLLTRFLAAAATPGQSPQMTSALLEAAQNYPWPENLKQLGAVAEHLLQRKTLSPLDAQDFQAALDLVPTGTPADRRAPRMVTLEQVIQEHVRAMLLACNGNKLRTAEVLGISRSTLYRMLESPGSCIASLPLAG